MVVVVSVMESGALMDKAEARLGKGEGPKGLERARICLRSAHGFNLQFVM